MTTAARVERQQAERQAILKAAYSLIGRSPDSTVSVHEILSAAGLSTRAFYRHFRSKDELILTMYRTAADRVNAELSKIVSESNGPVDALEASIRQHLAVVYDARRARQARVLTSPEVRAAAGFDRADHESDVARRALLAEVLRRGQREGTFPHVTDPELDARAVMGVLRGLIESSLAGQPVPSWSEATAHTTNLFLRAFGAPLPTDGEPSK
ncbi:MAG: TetR/AcrR family transcriptional regulator [Acidimicrobiia bacterium]